jgi:thiol-disulfide isomerase/thioredoxin
MTVFERVHIPSLGGATGWLNSEPLGPAELRGHVVLVNFWTLTCINWLRQEPYVRAWSQAYRDDGLIVIGVHTPEFSFEHELDGVRQATKERAIDYPIALDNDWPRESLASESRLQGDGGTPGRLGRAGSAISG